MWPWRKRKVKVPDTPEGALSINLDNEVIDLDDPNDPTSLFFQLSLRDGPVLVDEGPEGVVVVADGHAYHGKTQVETLMKAILKENG